MTIFQAVVLGTIQGLAEFLPISSSAHLAIAPWLFGWEPPGLAFDVSLHVGTLFAVLWYFRRDWMELVAAAWSIVRHRRISTAAERRALFLVVATIPAGLAGLFLEDYAETVFRAPVITGVALIVLGIVLWLADRTAPNNRTLDDMRLRDAVLIGCAQALALVPGVSRSGATITAGRALALDRQSAAVFSFLMSMPIISAAAILEVPAAVAASTDLAPLVAGILASAVSGWLAITVLLRFVSRNDYGVFALYRLVFGAFVLWLVYSRGIA
ncbi:MAG TPA: undecaprenyl-diphosphatase UppP [Gemmatimonadales bacterium]